MHIISTFSTPLNVLTEYRSYIEPPRTDTKDEFVLSPLRVILSISECLTHFRSNRFVIFGVPLKSKMDDRDFVLMSMQAEHCEWATWVIGIIGVSWDGLNLNSDSCSRLEWHR